METRTDDETLLESLRALSNVENSNRPLSPRQLQTAVEIDRVQCATKILELAEGVTDQLTILQRGIHDLQKCSEQIQKELEIYASSVRPYLECIEKLEADEKVNQEKEKLIDEFLKQYQLLPAEATVLESGDVNEEFFKVLQRAQSIHANCKDLLRTQHRRAGLELMDTMASHQESALKRLVQWIQTRCQEIVDVEAAEMDALMQQALRALSARPVLYRYCAEEVAEARHDALFERFVSSLSQGARPIEMQSDDPKRYLNDMLAWVHQSLASEMELLEGLFKDIPRAHQPAVGDLPSMTHLLNKIFHSIDRPLKVRIEQVLMLPPVPVLCFELAHLLDFYVGTIRDVAGQNFALLESLQNCLAMAIRTLHEQIHARGIRLSRRSIAVPRDLSPPPELTDTIHFLLQILNSNASTLKAADSQEGLSVAALVTMVLDPLLGTCRRCAADLESGSVHQSDPIKSVLSKNIFLINCLEALVSSLSDWPAAAQQWNGLQNQLEVHSKRPSVLSCSL